MSDESAQLTGETKNLRSIFGHLFLLLALVGVIYGARIGTMPLRGEESRWARGTALMMETGDWIVPRQQREVFPERPPLNSWAMAVASAFRGTLDATAVRLPSVLAIVLTTLLVFVYARTFLDSLGAVAAAAAFATMGQVLQIGRLGESEAVFTMFISGSLLLWHMGYVRRWPPLCIWLAGYSCAALGALTKGLQAPIYFGAAVTIFLLWQRDWRTLFSWPHAAGIAALAVIVGAWQIPFYLMTGTESVVAVWTGLAGDRVGLSGLLTHLASYPLETLVCLFPWSLMLMQLVNRPLRESLRDKTGHATFLVIAIMVAYPTVWFSVGARGRYFMPLYPCIAILLGLIIQRSVQSPIGSYAQRGWNRFLWTTAIICAGAGVVVAGAGVIPQLKEAAQPPVMTVVFAISGLAVAVTLLWASRGAGNLRAQVAIYALTAFLGLAYTGVMINAKMATGNGFAQRVADAKARLPVPKDLASFGAVAHRFCFYYEDTIAYVPWPERIEDVPAEVEYFCFEHHPGDTPERRTDGRGRLWSTTSGTLPFAWEEIARVGCDSRDKEVHSNAIVIGRVVGPLVQSPTDAGPHSPRTATLQKTDR